MRLVRLHFLFLEISIIALLFGISFPVFADDHFITGSLANRYKLRTTGGVHDHDIDTILTLRFGNSYEDRVSGAFQGGGIFDLNGKEDDSYFSDIYDTFSSSAVGRLYYAYMDVNDLGPLASVRAGRQHLYELESLYFDGVSFETLPVVGFKLSGYAGVPVHQFENQFGFDVGDWLVGGALDWRPVSAVRFRFDYTHLKDKISGFRVTANDQEDDLIGGSLWIDFSDNLDFFFRVTAFSDQTRDFEGASSLRFPNIDLAFRLAVYRLLNGYDVRVIDWDAYGIAGTYQPYTQISFNTTKGLGQHFVIDGGFVARVLDTLQTASAFNHGYERFYLAFSSTDFPAQGLDVVTSLDYYHNEDNTLKDHSFGYSLSATKKLLEDRLTIGGGTAFYLYRYNLLLGNESDDVQTFFANVEGEITKHITAKWKYELEHNDINYFHTLVTSVIWDF